MLNNIVFNEDCMSGLKKYPDLFFDLAICDIPYGINVARMSYLKEIKKSVKQNNGTRLSAYNNKIYTQKDWDEKPPAQEYFDELKRVSKNQIIFGIEYVNWQGVGTGRIKWDKGVAKGVSFSQYEIAYCSMIETEILLPLLWTGMIQAKSLKEPMTQQGNKKLNEKRIHPCHKPILLYEKLISDYGFEGCRIVDTHVGGGSIRIAADKLKCDFVGFEIDEEYFFLQEKRYKDFISQTKLPF